MQKVPPQLAEAMKGHVVNIEELPEPEIDRVRRQLSNCQADLITALKRLDDESQAKIKRMSKENGRLVQQLAHAQAEAPIHYRTGIRDALNVVIINKRRKRSTLIKILEQLRDESEGLGGD